MNTFPKFQIYYFSGTGNSKNVALWMSDSALKHGIESQIIDIAKIDRRSIEKPPSDALVIFVSPIHGFNYPPVMLNFISHFPKGSNKVLLMNTRAGMLIGKYVTPGLTGIAFYLSSILLVYKGYSIQGMVPVDLPSNWISVHPGLNERTVKYLHTKNKERVNSCAEKIISGKRDFKALKEVIQDIIIAPVSVLYYFVGRFCLAKTYYASGDCNNCDICIQNCPVKAIIKVKDKPYWTFKCESCMRCMGNCPKKAIETGHGYVLGIFYIYSAVTGIFYKFFVKNTIGPDNEILKFFFDTFVFLALLAISYRGIHYCMRFKLFEKLIVYSSLTKYKFWGRRYKALKDQ
jgi:Pyruvate/2-oxoacid:ferredoxin oxidoreductase delta subunit